MNRRKFLGLSSATVASALTPGKLIAQTSAEPKKLENDQFLFTYTTDNGLACTLTHKPTGTVLAKGPYFYSVGTPKFNAAFGGGEGSGLTVSVNGKVTSSSQSNQSTTLVGTTDSGLEITHTFRLITATPPLSGWLEEKITLKNTGTTPFKGEPRFAFTLPATPGTLDGYIFTAVPFRRESQGNRTQYADYKLDQILHEKRLSALRGTMKSHTTFGEGVACTNNDGSDGKLPYDIYGSEGWAFTNGTNGFLVTKYNPRAMEWTLLDPLTTDAGLSLRWGGAGIYCGDPEPACVLQPGESFEFGTTRLTSFSGDLTQGYYAFRNEMESRGHKVPNGYNPPLHWNELYDNKLWWLPDGRQNDPEMRRKYYQRADMEIEAAKAQAIGCEALYMDPGWDVSFASKIWDESRLGPAKDFVALMKSKYGLKVSLHTPLSAWCDPTSYSYDCCRLDEHGLRDRLSLCGASDQYVKETVRRLNVLADDGICFFMFDGSVSNGPCWDTEHGHPVPSRRHDHVVATDSIANFVHEKHPDVLMEMHDPVIGAPRYVPMYFGYGKDAQGKSNALGYDEIWAFELMWAPMQNLSQGNSICLYYYNLAYSQPLYLHVDLRTDNVQAIVFWWNASTCRHYGIGGTHADEAVRTAHKKAVTDYIRLKPHFASGVFYGINETIHVHRHPTASTAVINVFNIDPTPATKIIAFDPAKFGLPPGKTYKFIGGNFTNANGIYTASVDVASMGHVLIEVA